MLVFEHIIELTAGKVEEEIKPQGHQMVLYVKRDHQTQNNVG